MLKALFAIRDWILNILGDIKIYPWPAFIVYDPGSYKVSGKEYAHFTANLRDGDVVLRRFDRYLDTYFIPGWWSHAGIYWGGKITHAIAEGVVVDTLFDFCKTDFVCILRPKFLADEHRLTVMERINQAVGKPYDFSFNSNSDLRLFCSELIEYAFKGMDHGIKRRMNLGRSIAAPDDILHANFDLIYSSAADD